MMTDTSALQTFLTDNFAPWVLALDIRLIDSAPGQATLRIPITDQIARVGGIASGQTLATLADTAMVLATLTTLPDLRPVATITLDTQFLRPASGDTITAVAKVTRTGKSLAFARCTLTSQLADKPVATATATFAL